MQPFPDAGLEHVAPRLKVIHSGFVDFETASFTFALTSFGAGAEKAGLFLRDEVVEGLSLRDGSEQVLAVWMVWAQNSGDSLHLCECIRLTSVVSSIAERIGKS